MEFAMKSILELVKSDVKVSAHERFIVAKNFKKGNAGIYYLGGNFERLFCDKIEENVPSATLSSRRLVQSSTLGPIKAELGEGHEIFLAWLFDKVESQANGRKGDLLVDGRTNIFYVDGCAVLARRGARDGWRIITEEISDPDGWFMGSRVFSRNLALESLETPEPERV